MIKVMFVCHGNICRSPMAEYLFTDMVKKKGREKDFYIKSSATSYEEIGNPVHYGTERILTSLNIDCSDKRAQKLTKEDGEKYDYFIGMDAMNIRDMKRLFNGDPEGKVHKLLHFADMDRDVADPWYTGDFETTKRDVVTGCTALIKYLKGSN